VFIPGGAEGWPELPPEDPPDESPIAAEFCAAAAALAEFWIPIPIELALPPPCAQTGIDDVAKHATERAIAARRESRLCFRFAAVRGQW
jgi:hypothetical protein